MNFLLSSGMTFSLPTATGCRDGPSCSQFPRGTIHSLLGNGDGMECGCESMSNAKVVVGDIVQGAQRFVLQEVVLAILNELCFL